MNRRRLTLAALVFAWTHLLLAGDSALSTACQHLDGLGSGEITIVPVTCHDRYSHGNSTTAIRLISARNVPQPQHRSKTLHPAMFSNYHARVGGAKDDVWTEGGQELSPMSCLLSASLHGGNFYARSAPPPEQHRHHGSCGTSHSRPADGEKQHP